MPRSIPVFAALLGLSLAAVEPVHAQDTSHAPGHAGSMCTMCSGGGTQAQGSQMPGMSMPQGQGSMMQGGCPMMQRSAALEQRLRRLEERLGVQTPPGQPGMPPG